MPTFCQSLPKAGIDRTSKDIIAMMIFFKMSSQNELSWLCYPLLDVSHMLITTNTLHHFEDYEK